MLAWDNGKEMRERGLIKSGDVWVPDTNAQPYLAPNITPNIISPTTTLTRQVPTKPSNTAPPALPTDWGSSLSYSQNLNKNNNFSPGDIGYKSASELAPIGTVRSDGKKKRPNGMWLTDAELQKANMLKFTNPLFSTDSFGQIQS